jgi:hypothetical protein
MSQAEILNKAIATINTLADISDQLCDDCKQRIRQELRSQRVGRGGIPNQHRPEPITGVFANYDR